MLNNLTDLSQHSPAKNFQAVKENGIGGVFRKATQGRNVVDAKYYARRQSALAAGLLRGAHQFGTKGNVDAQIENFLDTVNPSKTDLLVLDFEPNGEIGMMTLTEAEKFVTLVKEKTGRFPGLYPGQAFRREKVSSNTATVLKTACSGSSAIQAKNLSPRPRGQPTPSGNTPRQRWQPTAPSPRHRTLRPRQIQRQPRRTAKTLGRLANGLLPLKLVHTDFV